MLTVLYNVSQKGRPTHEELMANTLFLANAVPWRLTHRDNFPARQLAGKNTGGRWDKPSTLTASTTGPLKVIAQKNTTYYINNFLIGTTSSH